LPWPFRIRVVTPITTEGFRSSVDAEHLGSEDVTVNFVNIDTGPASIECDYEIMLAQPGTLAKVVEAEREGADAVVIDCMGDVALFGARECVSIPVLGPMQTAMSVAAMMGHKFSVVTVLSRILPMIQTQAAVYGMTSKLASAHSVEIPVLELERDLAATKRALIAEARKAVVEDGADYIIFGCTGMLGCADAVHEGLRRPNRASRGIAKRRRGSNETDMAATATVNEIASSSRRSAFWRSRSRLWLLAVPMTLFFVVFFVLPVMSMFAVSLDKPAAGVVAAKGDFSAHERCGQHRFWLADAQGRQGRDRAPGARRAAAGRAVRL
jgi:allantoin racemase